MPILEKIEKHKNIPTAIIFGGANPLGIELSKLLIEQGAFIVLIDEYTEKKKEKLDKLLDDELFTFVDISGAKSLADSLSRVDYIFYLNHEFQDATEVVSTSDFLEQSNILDRLLELGVEKNSKFLLTSSIVMHRILQQKKDVGADLEIDEDNLNYTVLEVQRYAENLTWEYYKRGGLDARIIRIGDLLGEGIELDDNQIHIRYIKDAIAGKKLQIEGDGLDNLYFVHILDAAYGLIKAQFTPKTTGNIYSLVIPTDITILNLAYKILDLEPRAGGIDFVEKKSAEAITIYKPAKNLKSIGWKAKVTFERALAQTIDYIYSEYGGKKKFTGRSDSKAGSKLDKFDRLRLKKKKKRSLKDTLLNFFFEVKEEKKAKSVLDSVQYKNVDKKVLPAKTDHRAKDRVFLTSKKDAKTVKKKSLSWRFIDMYTNLRNSIRGVSLKKFGLYLLGVIVFLIFYIFIIVPFARAFYYGGVLSIRVKSARSSFESWDFAQAVNDLERASYAAEQVGNNASRLSFLNKIGLQDYIAGMEEFSGDSIKIIENSMTVSQSLYTLGDYMREYKTNIILKGSDDLEVAGERSFDFRDLGSIDVKGAANLLESIEINRHEDVYNMPLLGKAIRTIADNLDSIETTAYDLSKSVEVWPIVFASETPETYALMFLDAKNLTVRGGLISSLCVFTIDKGYVTDIGVYDSSEVMLDMSPEQNRFVMSELSPFYSDEKIEFKDLTMITNETTFRDLVSESIEVKFGRSPDHILTMNSEALRDMVTYYGGIEIEGKGTLNSVNFDEYILSDEISDKEIIAKMMNSVFQYSKEDISFLATFLTKHIGNKNLELYSNNTVLSELVKSEEYNAIKRENYDSLSISMINNAGEVPAINLEGNITLNKDELNKKIGIFLDNKNKSKAEGFILIEGSTFDDFDMDSMLELGTISYVPSGDDRLILEYILEGNSKDNIVIESTDKNLVFFKDGVYNYNLVVEKPYGFSYAYDITVDYEGGLAATVWPDFAIQVDTTLRLSGDMKEVEVWHFEFSSVDSN